MEICGPGSDVDPIFLMKMSKRTTQWFDITQLLHIHFMRFLVLFDIHAIFKFGQHFTN